MNCFIIPVHRGETTGALSLGEIMPISIAGVSTIQNTASPNAETVHIGSLTVYACISKKSCGPQTIRDLEMSQQNWFWFASLLKHFNRLSIMH